MLRQCTAWLACKDASQSSLQAALPTLTRLTMVERGAAQTHCSAGASPVGDSLTCTLPLAASRLVSTPVARPVRHLALRGHAAPKRSTLPCFGDETTSMPEQLNGEL
jgi:hypothetical protein